MATATLSGLDLLATAVMLVDEAWLVRYMNPAAENLFGLSSRATDGHALDALFQGSDVLTQALDYANDHNCSYSEHGLTLSTNGHAPLHLSCTVTPVEVDARQRSELPDRVSPHRSAAEGRARGADARSKPGESRADPQLAHEIKNPLGGHPRRGETARPRASSVPPCTNTRSHHEGGGSAAIAHGPALTPTGCRSRRR